MATASKTRLMLLFIMILLMVIMRNSEARPSHGISTTAKKVDSGAILKKLGYDLSKIAYYRRMLSGDIPNRVSPGGPDPQHHY
ncbi:hypothetical protein CCACVL1_16435 [Corchorus capsularis]|uniref:Uncharacterized protein n=1 Tax=Corchorus capsularis TaxID=210143 RepID=A0A1R3HX44_COCAP|nr:hypothetical protein CCACVL1_16435 [Corchorus capsularis]